jgi:drug/metabolite transporter (DMT)-like permease
MPLVLHPSYVPIMTAPRHFFWFMSLGLFWGVSPAVYKHLSNIGMPVTHTICLTGFGVGIIMWAMAAAKGKARIAWAVHRYGAICAFMMNLPFALNLYLAGHVPPTELAIIITTSPFFNYLLAMVTGWEQASARRLLAIAAGFASTFVLILSRDGMLQGNFSWWLIASLGVPILYCVYNSYAARAIPREADTLQLGAVESVWSGLWALPVLLVVAPFGAQGQAALATYWLLGMMVLMWVVERIAYFILIREKGAVYTVQATYVSTPAAFIISGVVFGGVQDAWLWLSLALLMVALYLNNTSSITKASTQPYA